MVKIFKFNLTLPKLIVLPRLMLLTTSLLIMFITLKKVPFSVDKSIQKKKLKMIDKVSVLFKEFELYEQNSGVKILIQDKENCKEKVAKMLTDGIQFLQVISDFDRTISCFMHNGATNITCHGVFESDPELSEEVRQQFNNLREKYYKIEIDTTMTNDEKVPFMVEWWTKAHDLMVKARLRREVLIDTVKHCDIGIRLGCYEFMKVLNDYQIPMLIFSAGVGNVISEILKQKKFPDENVRIVSNFMNFDNEGVLTGFQDEIIHTFNKSARSIQDSEFYDNICTQRNNVILLGDSTGDPHMSDGLTDDANVLKIGFLNCNEENLKEKYSEIYDIVIMSDESFTVPSKILDSIVNY